MNCGHRSETHPAGRRHARPLLLRVHPESLVPP
jgi:hypothetical protein